MNRRSLLQMFGVLPLLGITKSEIAEAQQPVFVYDEPHHIPPKPIQWPVEPPLPDTVQIFTEWQPMAEKLWANFQKFAATMPDWWQPEDMQLAMPICYRFCYSLLASPSWLGPGDEAAPFFPYQDPDLIKKNVSFGVADFPLIVRNGVTRPALARRLRIAPLSSLRVAMEDMRAYHGLNAETEMVSILGHEAALDVFHEIRKDYDNGSKVHTYALYQPPFLSGVDPKMIEEGFSVDRRWRMRYAKFA